MAMGRRLLQSRVFGRDNVRRGLDKFRLHEPCSTRWVLAEPSGFCAGREPYRYISAKAERRKWVSSSTNNQSADHALEVRKSRFFSNGASSCTVYLLPSLFA
jgi:hypothetical protein